MRRFVSSIIFSGLLLGTNAWADEAPAAGASVSGIFEGVDVGGSPRRPRKAVRPAKMPDSFAVNPAVNGLQQQYVPAEKHVQARSILVPSTEPVAQAAPAQNAPANQQGAGSQAPNPQLLQNAGSSSAQYFEAVIDQAKAAAAQQDQSRTNSKYTVQNKDKF